MSLRFLAPVRRWAGHTTVTPFPTSATILTLLCCLVEGAVSNQLQRLLSSGSGAYDHLFITINGRLE
jgi:hypothetical protein